MNIKDRKEKYCPVCEETKDVKLFHNDKSRADGRSALCASCRRAEQAALRATPERKEYMKNYYNTQRRNNK